MGIFSFFKKNIEKFKNDVKENYAKEMEKAKLKEKEKNTARARKANERRAHEKQGQAEKQDQAENNIPANLNPGSTVDRLLKEATALKKTNIEMAIKCLKDVKHILEYSSDYPIETHLRLPLFLQQAGRFDEAITEFQNIITHIEKELKKEKIIGLQMVYYAELSTVYDKMRLACKREKRPSDAEIYENLSIQCDEKHNELYEIRNKSK